MKKLLCWGVLFVAIFLTSQSRANVHYSSKTTRAAVTKTIEDQLDAMRKGDYRAAFDYAAAPFKIQFTAATFERLIRRNYPVIARNIRAEFGLSQDDGIHATVVVTVFTAAGDSADFTYGLVNEDGIWKVAAVVPAVPIPQA